MAGRVGRSLQLSEEGKDKAQKALTDRCLTQKELGKELGFSRETISKFFRGLTVDRQYFVKICQELGLEWDENLYFRDSLMLKWQILTLSKLKRLLKSGL